VFQRSAGDWTQIDKLLPDGGAAGDRFGHSTALCGDAAVVGAPYHHAGASQPGSAYVFRGSDPNDPSWPPEAELSPIVGTAGDHLGHSVGISGLAAIVGAPCHRASGPDSGRANMVHGDPNDPTDWHQRIDRLLPDGAAYDEFGCSVAIEADVAVIGAPGDDENGSDSGAAHVFRWSDTAGWQRTGIEVLADDGGAGDAFGFAVAVAGDRALIGAPCDDDNGSDAGAAYVFRCDDLDDPNAAWSQESKLTLAPAEGDPDDLLGYSVAIRDDVAVVGAPGDDYWGPDAGAVHVFRPDPNDPNGAWLRQATLLAVGGNPNDRFGSSVAIDGNRIVVGAPYDDDAGTDAGAIHVFYQDPDDPYGLWAPEAKLTLAPAESDPNDLLGYCVDIDGENVIAGALGDDDCGTDAGAVYAFIADPNDPAGWSPYAKLRAPDGAANDWFGYSVALSGDIAVIGAPQDDYGDPNDPDYNSGTAYVFSLTCPDRDGDGYCDEGQCLGDIDGDGDVDLADLAQLLAHYGMTGGATYEDGDLDGDGDVDLSDLAQLLAVYGQTCA
jgi:hypothetical protein